MNRCPFPPIKLFAVVMVASMFIPRVMAGESKQAVELPTLAEQEKDWIFEFRPYLWTASLSGEAAVAGLPTMDVDLGFDDILRDLDMTWAATFNYEHKNGFVFFMDTFYLRMKPDVKLGLPGPLSFDNLETEQIIIDPVFGYRIIDDDKGWVDFVAGVRWTSMDIDLGLKREQGGGVDLEVSEDWFDPHLGFRGRWNFNETWYGGGIVDIGGFGVGSDLTFQVGGGVGYKINERFAVEGMYRYLYYDYDNDGFIWNTDSSGFFFGCVIKW